MKDHVSLQTPVNFEFSGHKFSPAATISGIGSCFAERMTDRLYALGFEGSANPTGIVYNAVSIRDAVRRAVDLCDYQPGDFFEFNGMWHSWEHHGRFSRPECGEAVAVANSTLRLFREMLKKSDLFILTPSSSVVYRLVENGRVAANCHKVPHGRFSRDLLSVEQNRQAMLQTIESLQRFNPRMLIIITLSPVRHYPGNLQLNSRSKANLLAAIHECIDIFPEQCVYFPSYEIVMDELRDYRFFSDDMLHPSELAGRIIFNRFVSAFFDDHAIQRMEDNERIIKAEQHRSILKKVVDK